MMDGSAMNRTFTSLMFKGDPRLELYTTRNPYNVKEEVCIVQDIKHCLKKIRNSVFSSSLSEKAKRSLLLNGHPIVWEHFIEAYNFNKLHSFRLYRRLTKEHIHLTTTNKMRNHLCEEVLNSDMLNLMEEYVQSLSNDRENYQSTVEFLRCTSILVDIFTNVNSKIDNKYDVRINEVRQVLEFFTTWEEQFSDPADIRKHLISQQTHQDINSTLMGFLTLVDKNCDSDIAINPGFFNSDLIENWFCQLRGVRGGLSNHPTISQIGPAINTNILTGNVISVKSKKSNASGKGLKSIPSLPPKKKRKK